VNHAQEPDMWDLVVLALPAAPINFMPQQIQLQDIGGNVLMEEVEDENPNFLWGGDNLQVGMALLPASLDIDPVLFDKQQFHIIPGRPHSEGIIIWSRFFAPMGQYWRYLCSFF
jgi:hypothetical protein